MRLKTVSIGTYKNLRDFSLTFDGDGFIDVFVGKNGSGKSNFLEALTIIFDHLFGFDAEQFGPGFDYQVIYSIGAKDTAFAWTAARDDVPGVLTINGRARKTIGATPLPDNIIVYYSGQNAHVAEIVSRFKERFRRRIKGADLAETPRFIGIGPSYKKLLILLLLLLPEDRPARQFLCQKLGILGNRDTFKLNVSRPIFARRPSYDHLNPEDLFWELKVKCGTF